MKLIVGLGNPGAEHRDTRHNVGFRVAARFAERAGIALDQARYAGRFGAGAWRSEASGVLLPETWMNRSGDAVRQALDALPECVPARDLLVVTDDVDLPLGRLRVRAAGGDGGHRGLRDILGHLETREVPRLRVGVGRPAGGRQTVDWVLDAFAPDEQDLLESTLDRATDAVACFVSEGATVAMDRFNAPPAASPEDSGAE